MNTKYIKIPIDFFDHLLNCLDNQKFIHEFPKKIKRQTQKIIDTANKEARELLYSQLKKK